MEIKFEDKEQEQGITTIRNIEQGIGVFASASNFESAQRMAMALSKSTIVPKIYQSTPDNPGAIANCIIALETANRIGASPLLVMQNLYVVHGNPGWSSKFLIACLNTCGRFTAIQYEMCGEVGKDTYGCRAWANEKATGKAVYGAYVTIEMAKKEGWFNKSGSKWQTMPELMLQYRAAAFFQRAYAPEISMGMLTSEEHTDIGYSEYTEIPVQTLVNSAATIAKSSIASKEEKIEDEDMITDDLANDIENDLNNSLFQ